MEATYPDPARRNLITLFVMMGSFMSQLDVTIANVALPYMQGSTGASSEQITWVLTSYIVTAAIFTPLTGWLASRFGRRRLMIVAITGFTVASMLCGIAVNLPELIVFRILQGMMGAALLPISQALLLDINPPERHGQAMAIWGSGTVFGPIVGPIAGGWLTSNLSWRWVFFINVPVGIVAVIGLILVMRNKPQEDLQPLDFFGFGLLAVAVGCLQLVLDRGQIVDWFNSTEIWIETGVGLLAFYCFAVHMFTAKNPFVKPALFNDRNYLFGSILSIFVASTMFGIMALLPPMLTSLLGYDAQQVGQLIVPRGIGALSAMMVVGQLVNRFEPRLIIIGGLIMTGTAAWNMSGVTLDMDGRLIALAGLMQGVGTGMMFVPLSTMVFTTLPPHLRNEGSAFSSLLRNLGGSISISVLQVTTLRNAAIGHARLVENIRPDNPVMNLRMPDFDPGAADQLLRLNFEVTRQAAMLSYAQSFSVIFWGCILISPVILLLRTGKRRA